MPEDTYREGTGAVILDRKNLCFVGKRRDTGTWQLPQGGRHPNEDWEKAMAREVYEETGLTKLQILDRTPNALTYRLPEKLMGNFWGGEYVGQRQFWYLLRLEESKKNIDLTLSEEREFTDWDFWPFPKIAAKIVDFKRDLYKAIFERFGPMIGVLPED